MSRYAVEVLEDVEDDGTMPQSLAALSEAVVGHRIVGVEGSGGGSTVLTLDTGQRVWLIEEGDCCAYTEVDAFLLHPELVDHMIMGVGTTDGYTTWHIYADAGDVLELVVGWSGGNLGYYGYGFTITVDEA